ncbi:MAG TPA: flagellar export chaperone FliS [Tepidisphaeraceae bacterium]|jgi:flagellar protein FliS|nr:flagellar export chaperone FliS [Tepidisphaeraceae bacterium]
MNPQAAQQQYLKTRVMTATPEQLQLMLYDGAVRFAEQGRAALIAKQFEQSYNSIGRVQRILTELTCSLKRDVSPELCDRLRGLYTYAYKKLIEANTEHTVEPLDEVIELLKYQRETWAMLLEQLGKQKAGAKAAGMDIPAPNERMEQSIRISA